MQSLKSYSGGLLKQLSEIQFPSQGGKPMALCRVIVCDLKEAVGHLPELSLDVGFNLEEVHSALVKPNICGLYHPSLDLLSSVVEFLLPRAESVVIGETKTIVCKPEEQFEKLGVAPMLERFGQRVRAVDLTGDQRVEVQVPNPHAIKRFLLPKTVLESDLLVNVPKVGTWRANRLTCALKNLFGLVPQKRKYYRHHLFEGMEKVIADIAQIVKPDLNIVDAGNNVILGTDALAVDVVACKFIGLDPLTIGHLTLVAEDRNEKLESFIKKIDVAEPQIRV
jgi:uncharacterized protein (DUF362 family)